MRTQKLTLSRFAHDAVAGEGWQGARYVPARIARSIPIYLADRDLDRPGWRYPGFLEGGGESEGVELEIEVDEEAWRSLEREAERQGVPLPRLVEHVALYFAAEVNAGRVTRRILDDIDAEVEREAS